MWPDRADGTEAAIKLAKTYTGRDNVIAFSGGYHGMTHGALAMTGNLSAKQKVGNLMAGVQFCLIRMSIVVRWGWAVRLVWMP